MAQQTHPTLTASFAAVDFLNRGSPAVQAPAVPVQHSLRRKVQHSRTRSDERFNGSVRRGSTVAAASPDLELPVPRSSARAQNGKTEEGVLLRGGSAGCSYETPRKQMRSGAGSLPPTSAPMAAMEQRAGMRRAVRTASPGSQLLPSDGQQLSRVSGGGSGTAFWRTGQGAGAVRRQRSLGSRRPSSSVALQRCQAATLGLLQSCPNVHVYV